MFVNDHCLFSFAQDFLFLWILQYAHTTQATEWSCFSSLICTIPCYLCLLFITFLSVSHLLIRFCSCCYLLKYFRSFIISSLVIYISYFPLFLFFFKYLFYSYFHHSFYLLVLCLLEIRIIIIINWIVIMSAAMKQVWFFLHINS